jgi:2-amino-4-hydroxy-6-hydroxymethyldihydropteridine diphosphokinase
VRIQSDETAARVAEQIERLHELSGRVRGGNKWVARPLDIDLLLYDDLVVDEPGMKLPRGDVLEYSFVLRPLAELAPQLRHPVTGRTMLEHWQEFDSAAHPLELVGVVL